MPIITPLKPQIFIFLKFNYDKKIYFFYFHLLIRNNILEQPPINKIQFSCLLYLA
jgi:hypothetical protein